LEPFLLTATKVGQIRQVVEAFAKEENFILVMCPEGTRKKTKNWKRGFIKMAQNANVPVYCGFIDYNTFDGNKVRT
jgi:1-acyl-sn-glycerol-3-phosphate acyltransferase